MGEIAAELSAPAARIGAAAWPGPPRIDAGIELALQRRTRRRAEVASPAGRPQPTRRRGDFPGRSLPS